jgi:hypothetical protein
MSVIATAAPASAASPIVDLFKHGHKKGGQVGSGTSSSAADAGTSASSAQAPATNGSLFSSLLDSLEQVIGVSLTAPAPAPVPATATAASATTAAAAVAPTVSGGAHSFTTLGANVNAKA